MASGSNGRSEVMKTFDYFFLLYEVHIFKALSYEMVATEVVPLRQKSTFLTFPPFLGSVRLAHVACRLI